MQKPRVGIDMHVVDGFFQGSRTHVLQLFSRVIEISPEIDFYLFLDRPDALHDYSSRFSLPNVHLIRMPTTNPFIRLCIQFPLLRKKYALDLLHMQNILPLPGFSPCMVTIHDVLFEAFPQFFPIFFRVRSKILMKLAAMQSKHVFTVSEYSKSEIVNRYAVNPDKVTVMYNGVDTAKFFPGNEGKPAIESIGLTSGGYILTTGRLDVRKNHINLLKAYAKLREDAPMLVIVGQRDYKYAQIYETIDSLKLNQRVKILENVDDSLLPALYRHAKFFVYTSWAEGFGMPLVEAMASGIPVICSDTTSLPEIAGNCGILIHPGNIEEISTAMAGLLLDNEAGQKLKLPGLERCKSFQWDVSAQKVHGIYSSYFDNAINTSMLQVN
jgi:glycosyltransferase involved in cell wall biosynthesis